MPEIPDDITLIPAEDALTADEELAGLDLLDPDTLDVAPEEAQRPYGMTWLVDEETGQMVLHGRTPAAVSGPDSVRVWALLALNTKRFAHPIFSDDFGMDEPNSIVGFVHSAERNAEYARDVRETLLVHDRITEVKEFHFRGDLDEEYLEMDATIVLDDEEEIALENVLIERPAGREVLT